MFWSLNDESDISMIHISTDSIPFDYSIPRRLSITFKMDSVALMRSNVFQIDFRNVSFSDDHFFVLSSLIVTSSFLDLWLIVILNILFIIFIFSNTYRTHFWTRIWKLSFLKISICSLHSIESKNISPENHFLSWKWKGRSFFFFFFFTCCATKIKLRN